MIQVVFKNLARSDIVKNVVEDRVRHLEEKFPELHSEKLLVTLSMENSPYQRGPDHYTVRLITRAKKFKDTVLERSAPNLYIALADVIDRALEVLHRKAEKRRERRRWQLRHGRLFARSVFASTA